MGRFSNRCTVVTGGASGIGEATVRALVREGGSVVIADLQFPWRAPPAARQRPFSPARQ